MRLRRALRASPLLAFAGMLAISCVEPAATCPPDLREHTVRPGSDDARTEIHAAAAFDGSGVWLVYNRPDEGGDFDVYATRLDCRGDVDIEPFLVQSDPAFGNDVDPEVAVSGGRVLIAWVADDGTGENNLSVRYRVLSTSGEPITEDRRLATTHEGVDTPLNHLGVQITVHPDGRFLLAGSRGIPAVPAFSAYAQYVSRDGDPVGATLEPEIDAEAGQLGVTAAITDSGAVWMAWEREPAEGASEVRVRSFAQDAPQLAALGLESSGQPQLLADGETVWAVFTGEQSGELDLYLTDVSRPLSSRASTVIGEAGRLEHSGRLARDGDGHYALVFFRQISGFTNELQAASWSAANPPTVGETRRLDTMGAPSYAPPLTHVGDDVWFAGFSEGANPNFRVVGELFRR